MTRGPSGGAPPGAETPAQGPNPAALAMNLMRTAQRMITMAALMAERRITGAQRSGAAAPSDLHGLSDPLGMARLLTEVTLRQMSSPRRLAQAQLGLWQDYMNLGFAMFRRLAGNNPPPVATPRPGDKRFRDAAWQKPGFDTLRQAYLIASQSLEAQVRDTPGMDSHTRRKAAFYVRLITEALSPGNFLLTNPEALRQTWRTNAENLVRGMDNLLADLERSDGALNIRQVDPTPFRIGDTIATAPGKVVFQNSLMQLIQYAPSTPRVYAHPLLIIPPWINKFYILDLTPEKSFIRWAVAQGHTVFVVSWVNPGPELANTSFEDYMRQGILAAVDAVEQITQQRRVNAIGYCIGGTLLASTLAWMAARKDERIASATFFAAQADFSEPGELSLFIDEEQLRALEQRMAAQGGVLAGRDMAQTFNLLRANDLIWSYVIGNYLLGGEPPPLDLLYWNADATRMPAATHLFYLRQFYLHNALARGKMRLGGEQLDLGRVKIPIYLQSSLKDHIAPYASVYKARALFGGQVRFIIAGSGHIAGVINPPQAGKYQYWVSQAHPPTAEAWLAGAEEHPGSWWPDWQHWIGRKSGPKVSARAPDAGALPVLEDAPGSYVLVQEA